MWVLSCTYSLFMDSRDVVVRPIIQEWRGRKKCWLVSSGPVILEKGICSESEVILLLSVRRKRIIRRAYLRHLTLVKGRVCRLADAAIGTMGLHLGLAVWLSRVASRLGWKGTRKHRTVLIWNVLQVQVGARVRKVSGVCILCRCSRVVVRRFVVGPVVASLTRHSLNWSFVLLPWSSVFVLLSRLMT